MGKGFAITSDLNLGEMLLAGYSRHHDVDITVDGVHNSEDERATKKRKTERLPKIRIAAIANDTVATFASSAYAAKSSSNSRVAMGLIVGTGTNATVPMKLRDLHESKRSSFKNASGSSSDDTSIIVNTEWTIKGTDVPMKSLDIPTRWDAELDAHTNAPGFQPFEYMTSGRYLGELARLVFEEYCSKNLPSVPSSVLKRNTLTTTHISNLYHQNLFPSTKSRALLLQTLFPFDGWADDDFTALVRIAKAVQMRSSALIAAAAVGLLACVDEITLDSESRPSITETQDTLIVAYTGGLISKFPQFLETCQHWIDVLVTANGANAGKRVILKEALDGGIVGAAVLAAMSSGVQKD